MNKHIRGWIDTTRTERVYKYRDKSLVKLYNKVLRKSVSHTKLKVIDLMGEVLGIDLSSEEFDEGAHYVRLCNVPCPCKHCRVDDYNKCKNPFKDYMRSRVVKLEQARTKGMSVRRLSEEDEREENEDTPFDDM